MSPAGAARTEATSENTLICRGGPGLVLRAFPPDSLNLKMNKRPHRPAEAGLAPGECAWLHRGWDLDEEDEVLFARGKLGIAFEGPSVSCYFSDPEISALTDLLGSAYQVAIEVASPDNPFGMMLGLKAYRLTTPYPMLEETSTAAGTAPPPQSKPEASGRAQRPSVGGRPTPIHPRFRASALASVSAPRPADARTLVAALRRAPIAECPVFPVTNVWNRIVSGLPVHGDSASQIASIGLDAPLHADFGSTGYGIPINIVQASTPGSSVVFDSAAESDQGPYPIPADPAIESNHDRHLIMWDPESCRLYELFQAQQSEGGWTASTGALWDLRSNHLRPDGWASADAAGLPILPGLVRRGEVATGAIRHAIRFTAPKTRAAHIYPARHHIGTDMAASLPPMGTRIRLRANVDISGFGPQARAILAALKAYGLILADQGLPWFISGIPDPDWDDEELDDLKRLTGRDFEVVDTSGLVNA